MATANDIAQLAASIAQLAERLAVQRPDDVRPESRPLPPRVLLTVEEAGERLGIGRTTAYSLVRSGALESVRIGRLRRISISAIDAFAARLVAGSAGEAAA